MRDLDTCVLLVNEWNVVKPVNVVHALYKAGHPL